MRFLIRLFLGTVISFIVLVCFCVFVLYLAVSRQPFAVTLNSDASLSAMMNMKSNLDKESRYILSGSYKGDRKLAFTTEELNSAFNLYLSANQLNLMFNSKASDEKTQLKGGSFENGKFVLYVSQKISFYTPFGSYLNIKAELIPVIKDKRLNITFCSFKTGSVPIPAFVLNQMLKSKDTEINNMKEVKLLINAIKELEVNNDSITITYNPKKLSELAEAYSERLKL